MELRLETSATLEQPRSTSNLRSRRRENGTHVRIVVQADPSLVILGEPLERLRELLDDDASPDESVKGDAWRRPVSTPLGRLGSCDV